MFVFGLSMSIAGGTLEDVRLIVGCSVDYDYDPAMTAY